MLVNQPIHVKPGEVRCPRCFNLDIVPSKPRGWLDALMAWLGRTPRHCRSCGRRFYVLSKGTGQAKPASGAPPQ